MKPVKYVANLFLSALAAGVLSLGSPAYSQEIKAQQEQEVAYQKQDRTKASGAVLNTTQGYRDFGTSTLSVTALTFPASELWIVGGQNYRLDKGKDATDFDIGLKYLKGSSMQRGTLFADNSTKGKENVSAGADWDVFLGAYRDFGVSLLGDLSSVKKGGRYTDFGAGPKITSGDHNLFLLYSSRGEKNASDYRTGYMFLKNGALAAMLVDYAGGRKPLLKGFLGLPDKTAELNYNLEDKSLFANFLVTFGTKPLSPYISSGFAANQLILTKRSVTDSENTHIVPPALFLEPAGGVSDALKFNFRLDTKTGRLDTLLLYNALMFRTTGDDGVVLTQNINHAAGKTSYGAGIGYKLGKVTPVIRFQGGEKKMITLDLNVLY